MASTETLSRELLGEHGEPCRSCGAPLSDDQRYCLNCGGRRGDQRVDYRSLLGDGRPAENGSASPLEASAPKRTGLAESPLAAVLGIAVLGLMLLLGVLIGKGNSGEGSSPAPVVQVGGGSTADTATKAGGGTSQEVADTGTFSSDWPSGKSGYTVELGTLPKSGTSGADVEAQKKQAGAKGAPEVGALDSDQYASLPGGKYVIYSGVYDSKTKAEGALAKLKKSFPGATVVRVSKSAGGSATPAAATGPTTNSATDLTSQAARNAKGPVTATDKALNDLNSKSGQAYEDAIKKLPDQIATQGKPPPLNPGKQTGGGSGTITIGGG